MIRGNEDSPKGQDFLLKVTIFCSADLTLLATQNPKKYKKRNFETKWKVVNTEDFPQDSRLHITQTGQRTEKSS